MGCAAAGLALKLPHTDYLWPKRAISLCLGKAFECLLPLAERDSGAEARSLGKHPCSSGFTPQNLHVRVQQGPAAPWGPGASSTASTQLVGPYGRPGQGCGQLETGPAAALLGQGLTQEVLGRGQVWGELSQGMTKPTKGQDKKDS